MIQKPVAIILAVLINCAVLAWFDTWNTTVVADAASSAARVDKVVTLPTITVRPTPAQIESLRQDPQSATTSGAAPTGGAMQTLVMPYYSFAGDSDVASSG